MDAVSIKNKEYLESVLEEQEVKTSKYDKPLKAFTLMDIGLYATILKSHVLPAEMWAPFHKKFSVANKKVFNIDLIFRKPIRLKIFADQTTWLRVLKSYLPEKDVLFEFDVFLSNPWTTNQVY
ncbi:hypothetical protein Ahy_A08g040549 isoform B [Arachis hypogaea]|uniref:Uncharacterized protein n=1 Tax=Arachis hypogaea TaxID=3818 RepID=A0A445BZI0_ARAHY|nr:hypothetical protein Ahy_A08g040549 isoform B [Arachis hypogaea]